MDKNLTRFIKTLENLKAVIESASIHEGGFSAHGWNQVYLKKRDIEILLSNQIGKLQSYGDAKITEGLDSTIEEHIEKVDELTSAAKSYFTNNATHLLHFVPNILLTLQTIFSDIEYELFSYENINDKKLLPRGLSNRLRSVKSRLDALDESNNSLKEKAKLINEAHEAAESLPTDLESLKEARAELNKLIKEAKEQLTTTTEELKEIISDANDYKSDAARSSEAAEKFELSAKSSAEMAEKLVQQCDDALQITTTQGLAAGFDQKAKELNSSIWVWIFGLLVALGSGAWIGAERVEAFTQILNNDLTAGQAILHTIMSLFSIGAPLWLAWISTQQINQRFKLSEDYSYKATVAKSFTGFKKFAERFEPATEERLFNSTLDRFDEMPLRLIANKDYNSPWHEFIDSESFKKAIDIFPALAREAGKFASKTSLKTKLPTDKNINKTHPEKPKVVDSESTEFLETDTKAS